MDSFLENLVPLVAVFMVFAAPVALLWLALLYRGRAQARRQALYVEVLQHGHSIVPILEAENDRRLVDLRAGLILAMLGLGLLAFGAVEADRDWMAGAFLPLFTGFGFLLTYWIQGRRRAVETALVESHD